MKCEEDKNKVIQIWRIYYDIKSTLKRFGFNKTLSGIQDGEKGCLNNDGCFFINITGEEKVYTKKDA